MKMARSDEHPEVVMLRRLSTWHRDQDAEARRDLAAKHQHLSEVAAVLEEAYHKLRPPYQRLRIGRVGEVASLLTLGVAEVVVADTVVQSLGFTATATNLVAVAVGGTATGLAWLVGHEWAVAHDPQAAAAGRRGWLRAAGTAAAAFLAANLGVRIYYGVLAEQAGHLGSGLVAPVLSGVLLTVVTAALMVVAAFITAHAESGKEAHLRARLRRVRAELRSLENRVGVPSLATARNGSHASAEDGTAPAA
jgi:hypothetical protein